MDLRLRVKGNDAADIFPILGIALPPTPPYDVTGQLGLKGKVWSFNRLQREARIERPRRLAELGQRQSAAAADGELHLEHPRLPGPRPADRRGAGRRQNGERHAALAAGRTRSRAPFVIPDTSLDISRLDAMDADVTFTGKKVISSSLPLDDFYLHAVLDDKLLMLAAP